jgi:hypothetical protein
MKIFLQKAAGSRPKKLAIVITSDDETKQMKNWITLNQIRQLRDGQMVAMFEGVGSI